jgi:glycosyltransferase involved in cell wall biosynthesis
MRIHYFTGGPAGMMCGSCIRDNALAAELLRQGHKVLLLPIYTPTITDDENVSESRVFFSGLSVYVREVVPFLRRMPKWLENWLDSPRLVNALTKFSISNSPKQLGELTVSMLRGEDGTQVEEFHKLVEWLETQPRPEIVSIPYTLLIRLAGPIKRALGCAVVCTLQGEDLFLDGLAEPYRSQSLDLIRTHISDVDGFIATSDYYANYMSGYLQIPRDKIHVVPLGIRLDGFAPAERPADAPFTIGYFARIAPEKGLHHLVEAYRILRQELGVAGARLEVAGYLGPEWRSYLDGLALQIRRWGLESDFRYHGQLTREEKIRFLQSLDVLTVPTDYAEPKGLFLLEALACGVPAVQPKHGAFPEILERTRGGVLFEPKQPRKLAEKLHSLSREPELRREMGRMGQLGVREHYTVQREAARALEVYATMIAEAQKLSSTVRAS